MAINADIICDSINPDGKRLTTFVLEFPRIILAEFNTHRMFSRNAASSRAIPVKKMMDRIIKDPFIPLHLGKNKPGMQATEEVSDADRDAAKKIWLASRDEALVRAAQMEELGIHKQITNRLLEPWMFTRVVMSTTEIANFFALRDHHMAEPHMMALAQAMVKAFKESEPKFVNWGRWHLPFISQEELFSYSPDILVKFSTARCARVSYLNHDGTRPDIVKDRKLHDDLVVAKPLHSSPAEHPARAMRGQYGNFNGWEQYRKMILNENITVLPWEMEAMSQVEKVEA